MTVHAIEIDDLWKEYAIGSAQQRYGTLYELLTEKLLTPFVRSKKGTPEPHRNDRHFWALRDVSLQVAPGEVVGVIGRNGAGKSTLLKILSRITTPTRGRIAIRGRIASLLEVGTGFHPELSGRENIYLNASILGMSRTEVARKFDEIVAFAEVERFLETPVKRYSSGMYVRLAFAVAANLEPEILIVDEVLAVGDAEFQRKCLGKMKEVSAGEGRTVLFVSHNMKAVSTLCGKAVLLDAGRITAIGDTSDVISRYLEGSEGQSSLRSWHKLPGDDQIQLRRVEVVSASAFGSDRFPMSSDIAVVIDYEVLGQLRNTRVGFRLLTSDGTVVLTSEDTDTCEALEKKTPGHYRAQAIIPANLLNEGKYTLSVACHIPMIRVLFIEENCVSFVVEGQGSIGNTSDYRREGVVRPQLSWKFTMEPL